ncbi:DUF4138 domain-containing protein [Carboxylicivirga mesophila]|uniref:DUF4138 domain-containing protein n=1 Tax=Carboxylicivirga mesophila TaxID=1166478 RepID=A0ABS5K6X7_9BACT|nr:DUF4138 domain-containing protein [Carboxylicivirga mesophila]MBS2210715.1 DUF4138 domain-containing protein [Carboxylicivirga mesophila]
MMKLSLLLLLFLMLQFETFAQNHIQVAEHSTVHIICPEAVSYVQVGSPTKLLAEAIADYPHLVRIKALTAISDTSSLTLVCGNELYAFQVSYNRQCALQLNLDDFKGDAIQEQQGTTMPLHQLLACMRQLQASNSRRKPIKSSKQERIELLLDDIRVRQELLFVKITIKNHSNLVYKANVPVFMMRNRQPKKAANVQKYLLEPWRVSESELMVTPQEAKTVVFVFKSFSIPKHKQVEVLLQEETAAYTGRDLSLTFDNKAIVKAKAL